jgi:hypothetical protein
MENQELFGTFYGIFMLAIFVFFAVCGWRIFTKAGKPGWAAFIPIYNILIYLEIIGKPWWWLLLFLIPVVSFIISIWAANLLAKSFGHNEGFTVGLVLLPIIFIPVLAFGNSSYQGPAGLEAGVQPAY